MQWAARPDFSEVYQMTTTAEPEYKVIGTRPIRHDGVDKVIGRAMYGADLKLPGMLYGKVLRSPHPHARIISIDTSKAEAHPDVRSVATSGDLPDPGPVTRENVFPKPVSDNILARGKALYKGHPVAAVAATSALAAEEALALLEVEYEQLPWTTSLEEAIEEGAPVLHEHWPKNGASENGLDGPNVADHVQHAFGDLEKGFSEADVVIEREYRNKSVHQGYIEPQNATASWSADGRVTIWCSSQGHFLIQSQVAQILGLPVSKVKIVPMEIGGGFGGKLSAYLEPVAAVLSRKSGHPVQMTMSRAEVFESTGPTCGSKVSLKLGFTKEGRITAAKATYMFEAGAFPGAPLAAAAAAIFSPYYIENLLVDAYDIVDNKPKTAAYRAPGAPNVVWAVENLMDEIAEQLEMDPMELRLLNVATEGTRRADGVKNLVIGAKEVMEAVMAHPHYSEPLEGENLGRGVSMGFCRNNTGPACAIANVLADGTVSLVEGSVDIGGSRASLAQQLAETLGIPVTDVNPSIGDTDEVGQTSPTGGSGVTYKSGIAAYEAGMDVRRQMISRAAILWEVEEDQVEYVDGSVRHKSDPELRLTFREMASKLGQTGGPVVGRGNVSPTRSGASYAANIIDVEVDPETGKVDILKFTAFQDVGKAIHPSYVEGQIQGGSTQGVGWALSEEYFMGDDGKMANFTLLDYRMPTALDMPMIDPVIVEKANPGHPYGVRGAGESNIVPALAALANAIHKATGVRFRELPMSPGAVLKGIKGKNGA